MGNWNLAEAVVDGTLAYIASAQAAKLALVEARYTTIPCPMPSFVSMLPHEPAEHPVALDRFPALYMMATDVEARASAMGWARGYVGHQRYEFAVLARTSETRDQTAAEMTRRLAMRYIVALAEMLAAAYDATARPWEWGTGEPPRIYYAPLYTTGSGEYLGDARLIIGCTVREVAL